MKIRLDKAMADRGLVRTRSEAENWIRLGRVTVNGRAVAKAGYMVVEGDDIRLAAAERYVSRAGLKLASVVNKLSVQFTDQTVLDVGSSTGGFTDYALQHGAKKVYAVDVGTEQLHASLRSDPRIELHEKTDIRDVYSTAETLPDDHDEIVQISVPDIVVIDVSFVSLRQILPRVAGIVSLDSIVVAMVKPQFEARREQLTKTGIVKNDRVRRDILQDFEQWAKQYFVIIDKADSDVAGAHGNVERFYKLRKIATK